MPLSSQVVVLMSAFETLSLMIMFSMLVIALMNSKKK